MPSWLNDERPKRGLGGGGDSCLHQKHHNALKIETPNVITYIRHDCRLLFTQPAASLPTHTYIHTTYIHSYIHCTYSIGLTVYSISAPPAEIAAAASSYQIKTVVYVCKAVIYYKNYKITPDFHTSFLFSFFVPPGGAVCPR